MIELREDTNPLLLLCALWAAMPTYQMRVRTMVVQHASGTTNRAALQELHETARANGVMVETRARELGREVARRFDAANDPAIHPAEPAA